MCSVGGFDLHTVNTNYLFRAKKRASICCNVYSESMLCGVELENCGDLQVGNVGI